MDVRKDPSSISQIIVEKNTLSFPVVLFTLGTENICFVVALKRKIPARQRGIERWGRRRGKEKVKNRKESEWLRLLNKETTKNLAYSSPASVALRALLKSRTRTKEYWSLRKVGWMPRCCALVLMESELVKARLGSRMPSM